MITSRLVQAVGGRTLASVADGAEISYNRMLDYASGKSNNARIATVKKLADELSVSVDWLCGNDNAPNDETLNLKGNLGRRLRTIREMNMLRQKEVADTLGWSASTLFQIEVRGNALEKNVVMLAKFYGVSIDALTR